MPGKMSMTLLCPRSKYRQFSRFADIASEANASRAQDAALLIQHDMRADGGCFFTFPLVFIEARVVKTVLHVIILQFALTGLIADRTIQRMIQKEELKDRLPIAQGCRRLGAHHHAFALSVWCRTAAAWASFRFPPGTSGNCQQPASRDDSSNRECGCPPFWQPRVWRFLWQPEHSGRQL